MDDLNKSFGVINLRCVSFLGDSITEAFSSTTMMKDVKEVIAAKFEVQPKDIFFLHSTTYRVMSDPKLIRDFLGLGSPDTVTCFMFSKSALADEAIPPPYSVSDARVSPESHFRLPPALLGARWLR